MLSSLLFVVSCCIAIGVCSECPETWLKYGESCYSYSTDKLSWEAARTKCETAGGKLVEIETAGENNFLQDLARQKNEKGAWIGANDIATERTYVWVSSSKPLSPFIDWDNDEPKGGRARNCLMLWAGYDYNYKWRTGSCTSSYHYLCEIIETLTIV